MNTPTTNGTSAHPIATVTINDGPDYAPNWKRKVIVIRPADIPGFTLCEDVLTRERLIVASGRIWK